MGTRQSCSMGVLRPPVRLRRTPGGTPASTVGHDVPQQLVRVPDSGECPLWDQPRISDDLGRWAHIGLGRNIPPQCQREDKEGQCTATTGQGLGHHGLGGVGVHTCALRGCVAGRICDVRPHFFRDSTFPWRSIRGSRSQTAAVTMPRRRASGRRRPSSPTGSLQQSQAASPRKKTG